jgi:hypothetical protein
MKMTNKELADRIIAGKSIRALKTLCGITQKQIIETRKEFNIPYKSTFGTLPWIKKGYKA